MQGISSKSIKASYGLASCMKLTMCRRSATSSLRRAFSCRAQSWDSHTWLNLSSKLWFSFLSRMTWDHSSSRCLCFLILDLLADSRLDIIRLCLLSSMMFTCCASSESSEVELLTGDEVGGLGINTPLTMPIDWYMLFCIKSRS